MICQFSGGAKPVGARLAREGVLTDDIELKEQILLSDVIGAIASASLLAQFSVIASEGPRTSCHRPLFVSPCVASGRWINSVTACGCSSP
ncbi:Secreted protein [Pseudomonas sp. IT-P44]